MPIAPTPRHRATTAQVLRETILTSPQGQQDLKSIMDKLAVAISEGPGALDNVVGIDDDHPDFVQLDHSARALKERPSEPC